MLYMCAAAVLCCGGPHVNSEVGVIMSALLSEPLLSAYTVLGIAWLTFIWPAIWGGWYDGLAWSVSICRVIQLLRCHGYLG